jgi:hypothetical protein
MGIRLSGRWWWIGIRARRVSLRLLLSRGVWYTELMEAVAGESESEIMKLLRAIPKETGNA